MAKSSQSGQSGQSGHGDQSTWHIHELLTARNVVNRRTLKYYAAAISGLMVVFIASHTLRVLRRHRHRAVPGGSFVAKPFLIVSRIARRAVSKQVGPFPTVGHAALIFVYLAINVVFTFTDLQNKSFGFTSNLASRAGWMALGNTALVVLFALKNTPLAYLSAWSYERLNYLHQVAGWTTVVYVLVHAATYAGYFCGRGDCARLVSLAEIFGWSAGASALFVVPVAVTLRRFSYEAFYHIHIGFWIPFLVFAGLHQPDAEKGAYVVACLCGGMWCVDRLLRLLRLALSAINNSVTVHPLAAGGTRIVLRKGPWLAQSGQHGFVWIPGIRVLEAHPFTLASVGPAEFIVASYDGFTKDLHRYALARPGAELRASVEGPYGTIPDTECFDQVVMIAGGSGASFTFGRALNMLYATDERACQTLHFIWVVRDYPYLSWFETQLERLRGHANVHLHLFVTRPGRPRNDTAASQASNPDSIELAKIAALPRATSAGPTTTLAPPTTPATAPAPRLGESPWVRLGRPDIDAHIRAAVGAAPAKGRVLVLGCGPKSLMKDVRNGAVRCVRGGGPAVEVHCEEFGW